MTDTIESLRQQLAEVTNEKREYQLEAQGQIEFLDKKLAECQAQEAKLRDELETERMRLAGCGVAALGYFDGCCDTYKSASLDDVLRLRDRNAPSKG